MVSLIKGNGPEPAGCLPAFTAGGEAGRFGDRALGGPPDAAGAAVYAKRSGCAHSKGVDVPDRTTRTPERAGTEISARVSSLQRAGHCRSIGCLGFWTGRDGNGADIFDPGRGLWRGLWSLCFFLDDRDAAPLL